MTLTFTLTGQCMSGKNGVQTTRTGQHYPKPKWKAWRDEMVQQIRASSRPIHGWTVHTSLTVPCKAHVVFRHGDRRRRDVAGMLDALCHVLERAGVVKDDSLIVDWEVITSAVVHKHPSVWLKLETEWTRTT